jgi:hypothetical protein
MAGCCQSHSEAGVCAAERRGLDEVTGQAVRGRRDCPGYAAKVITAGSETNLSYFRSYSSGSRSLAVGHHPSASKAKSVASYATISLANAEANPDYVKTLQGGRYQSFYLDVG